MVRFPCRSPFVLALLCGALALTAPAMAAPTAAQARELAAMIAAVDRIDHNTDPQTYKTASQRLIGHAETLYPRPAPEVEKLRIKLQVARFALGELDGLPEDIERTMAVLAAGGPAWRNDLIDATNNLAVVVQARGDNARAIGLIEQAVALRREIVGTRNDGYLGVMIGNLAWAQRAMGDYDKALVTAREGVAILEESHRLQPDERDVADALTVALTNIQLHLGDTGLRAEAAEAARALVARLDSLVGAESPSTANLLINSAHHLVNDGKFAEAEAMVRRAIALRERALGMDAGPTNAARLRLVTMLTTQGRWTEALPIAEAATAGLEAKTGPASSETLDGRGKIARIAFALGDEVRGLAEMRALVASAREKLRPGHRDVLDNQEFLATMLARAGLWPETAQVLADLAEGRTAGKVAPSPRTAAAEALMAMAEAKLGNRKAALNRIAALSPRLDEWFADELRREGARGGRYVPLNRAIGWAALAAAEAGDAEGAFALAQRHGLGPSDRAVLRTRERDRSSGSAQVRQVQDITEQRDRALAQFARAATAGDTASARSAREQSARLDAEIARLGGAGQTTISPPRRLADVQAALAGDEAVLLVLETEIATRIFAVSRQQIAVTEAGLPTARIGELVTSLRQRLDWGADTDAPFDTRESDALHAALFRPEITRVLDGRKRVAVIARGELGRLPFAVLSLKRRDGLVEWAARRHAFVYPVGLDGIGASRRTAGRIARFVGVGAPALPALAAAPRGEARLRAFRGAANSQRIAGLGALGMAEDELRAMAKALAARDPVILAGSRATESGLRALDLSRADILTFATHGLVAGELDGLDEAALVLSPPAGNSGPQDDGLLTTTEIAAMRIGARLVVLSACNSASGDRAGDEALGGLAHAFLYAGAQSLMVSHWRVRDDAAARLTVATTAGMARGLDPATALQRAQIDLMRDHKLADAAHPAVWAPFVIVGE